MSRARLLAGGPAPKLRLVIPDACRDDMLAATKKQQEPFVYGSLPGEDFFFVGGAP
jgi:hypothetical protein